MQALIVGCGYLGRRLAARWLAQGVAVFGTTRGSARGAELSRLGITPIICDVLDPPSLRLLPQTDVVVHCVGFDRQAGPSMRRVYVEGLRNVLQALPARTNLVHVSSTSVYGQTAGEEVDESAVTAPVEESGQVVLEAEQTLQLLRPDAIVLRFAGIYGPGRLIRAKDLQVGRLLAIDPEKWLNLIHVEDGVTAILAALERGKPGGIYNVSDGSPVRRREFYTRLAELLGAAPPRFVPPPEPAPPSERTNRRIVNRRMRQELGVTPQYPSYAEGLAVSR